MLTKIYTALWITVAFAAGILFLTGNFTRLTAVVFGFVAFGLIFMGMMAVLPHSITHPNQKKLRGLSAGAIERKPRGLIEHARELGAELLSSDGVEIRKPKFH